MSNHLGNNFNKEEKEFITIPFDGIDEFVDNAFKSETSGTATQEDLSNSSEEPSFTPGFISIGDSDGESNKEKTETKTLVTHRNPLKKIGGGRVLQYPIDLNTDLQDYFEIQIFRYRPARGLPGVGNEYGSGNNQGYGGKPPGTTFDSGGYAGFSNRRGNRQNFRLQDLQSTIQLPMPPSIKDMNSVDFAGGTMSGLAAAMFGPSVTAFLGGKANAFDDEANKNITGFREKTENFLKSVTKVGGDTFKALGSAVKDKGFRRITTLNAIGQAIAALGVNIDVNQAITRVSGAVVNPNLELLFKGPALRSFSFTIRLTPRSPDESKRIRMIIRALKQHSAAKKNPNIFRGDNAATAQSEIGTNYVLGTPDVFKLRYIKARTQKDVKGLNKFKTCALNSISVDYTGEVGRFAAYEEDSQPVTSIITLSFTELTPIYDVDYAEFNNDDDVGL